MNGLLRLEKWVQDRMKDLFATGAAKEVLEVRRDVLEDVRKQIKPIGRDQAVFPYQVVAIRIAVMNAGEEAAFAAGLVDDDTLIADIRALLSLAGCLVPGLEISVLIERDPKIAGSRDAIEIKYSRLDPDRPKKPRQREVYECPTVHFRVLAGNSEQAEYTLRSERINLGRLPEVTSASRGLIRRNHVAFDEMEATVAREHAAIVFDRQNSHFRLCDQRSGDMGTRIVRDGETIRVPRQSSYGVQLKTGDEIHLGKARLVFEEL